jgi:hypothetical protein
VAGSAGGGSGKRERRRDMDQTGKGNATTVRSLPLHKR